MDLAQEAANLHAAILGFGYDDMIASKTAWVLSRMHVVFVDTPRWRDDVTLFTWHKGLERLFFLRDFMMTDREGNPKIKAKMGNKMNEGMLMPYKKVLEDME